MQKAEGRRQNADPGALEFELQYDSFGRLVLVDAGGERHVGIEPVRAFPVTAPQNALSIRDAQGRELLWIDDLSALSAEQRTILDAELAKREFVPQIHRILRVSLQIDPCEWEVETDRGRTKFVLKSEDDVRRLDDRRALVTDANGIRYLIPDTKTLDRASRRILERYL